MRIGKRVAVALVGIALVGGAVTGCGQVAHGGPRSPAGEVTTATERPTSSSASDDPSLSAIQDDLGSAGSATANAGNDLSDADSAAATSDSP